MKAVEGGARRLSVDLGRRVMDEVEVGELYELGRTVRKLVSCSAAMIILHDASKASCTTHGSSRTHRPAARSKAAQPARKAQTSVQTTVSEAVWYRIAHAQTAASVWEPVGPSASSLATKGQINRNLS